MEKHNKIKIPVELLSRTIKLLEDLDVSDYNEFVQSDYNDVMIALTRKKQSIELREAYARIIYAPDVEARLHAGLEYLQHKRDLEMPF